MHKLRQSSMDVDEPRKRVLNSSSKRSKSTSGLQPQISISSCISNIEQIHKKESELDDKIQKQYELLNEKLNTTDYTLPNEMKFINTQGGSISGMSFLEISDAVFGPRRYSDTTIGGQMENTNCQHKYVFYKNPTHVNYPSGGIKEKIKTGLETIGVDFMRVNGAVSGFKQLKRAEEFKTAHRQKKLIKSMSNASQPQNDVKFKSDFDYRTSFGTLKSEEVQEDIKIQNDHSGESAALCRRRNDYNNNNRTHKTNKNVGYRLGKRKELFEKRKRITDYSLLFAVFGVFIMILDLELSMYNLYHPSSLYSLTMKALIMISTVILVGLIMAYHVLEIKIFSWDDSIEDWRIAITWQRIVQMIAEVFICSIQPIPGNYTFKWKVKSVEKDVNLNIVLSLPMLLRLYLILRVLLLHSKLFSDAGSRSIGAMNKVSFNISFVLKTVMTTNPGTVLLVFILFIWLVFSWTMRICEVVYDDQHGNLFNSMWLISVTFLSIGYGDIVPHTYCGRGIAIATGVTGSACTALVVAVFARRLELSKAEKHVIHFMFENQLTKQLKNYAANVLRETWLIYKYTKLVKHINPMKVRVHQRKFLRAIHGMRQVKIDQRKLQDNSNTLVDLAKTQSSIYETVTEMRIEQNYLHHTLEILDQNLLKLQECIECLPRIVKDNNTANKLDIKMA